MGGTTALSLLPIGAGKLKVGPPAGLRTLTKRNVLEILHACFGNPDSRKAISRSPIGRKDIQAELRCQVLGDSAPLTLPQPEVYTCLRLKPVLALREGATRFLPTVSQVGGKTATAPRQVTSKKKSNCFYFLKPSMLLHS